MEAVMVVEEAAMMEEVRAVESGAGEPRAERGGTCEARAAKMPTGKMSAAAHGGEGHTSTAHAAAETTAMHSAAKSATVHAAAHGATKTAAMAAAEATATAVPTTATAATSGEGYGCKRNTDGERRRRENREEPVRHEILPDWDRSEPRVAACRA